MQEGFRATTNKVAPAAFLELGDAVVLAAEGDEVTDGRVIASFDVGAEELAALREAEGVDGRCGGEDGFGGELIADGRNLFGDISEKCRLAIGRGGIADVD